jgi:predicted anti-sigma-YlaC factor YlaD
MSTKNKIFFSCDEANHTCDKSQYKEASLLEMIKLNLHLLSCKACRSYSANNNRLTQMINKSKTTSEKDKSFNLDDDFKSSFEKALKDQK